MPGRSVTLYQTSLQKWRLQLTSTSLEGEIETFQRDILKKPSGTTLEPQEHAPGYFAISNEDPENPVPVEFDRQALQWGLAYPEKDGGYRLKDQPLLRTDFEFGTKKELKEVSGDLLTENPKKKILLPLTLSPRPNSALEVIREKPQTLTSTYLVQNEQKQKNRHLLHWLNSFPHTLPDPISTPSTPRLRWLLLCHKLQLLPLSLQQAHWPELLELEYPWDPLQDPPTSLGNDSEEEEVENLLRNPDPETQDGVRMEEGEIPTELEEGEIR